MKNGFELDYANNPELRSLFDSKSVGEQCSLTVKIQINEKDENRVKGSIVEIVSEDYGADGESKSVEADAEEPVMMVMVPGAGGKEPYIE